VTISKGSEHSFLTEIEVRGLMAEALAKAGLRGKRVLVIIPDSTRTAPIPLFFRVLHELLADAKQLDFLIALGTHPAMEEERVHKLVGITCGERKSKYARTGIFNHTWDRPESLKELGVIKAEEIEHISSGLMRERVSVAVNRRIFDYDQLIIVGPTFPHEVVGFSGGNKYFFPGISGPEVLNFFHWLGAVITNPVIIGTKRTPVRDVVDRAAAMIKLPKLCFSLVVTHHGLSGLYIGTPEAAYDAAADLSAKVHVIYCDRPYKRVLSCAPQMYDDIWTAGKCMYKLEPALADGAELIIYAPHIDEISYTHGKYLDRIGYHTRDYFLKQMEKFKDIPRGVLAHCTHVKGIGTYENGVERPRANVILATRIAEERCRRVNLGYRDPDTIDPSEWEGREKEGVLLVRQAGEMLYRLKNDPFRK